MTRSASRHRVPHRRDTITRALVAALLSIAAAPPVIAQQAVAPNAEAEAPSSQESALPPVRVRAKPVEETATGPVEGYAATRSATVTKTDTPLIETPQSVSVVTADRIEAIGATRLKDALAYTPGVNSAPWGEESQYDWIYLRGFDAYSPGFYKDGLQLRNAGTWGVWQTENYGAERIEIFRGPSSVLYGQNGPGGLVNVVSKRPSSEPSKELQLQLGSHQRRQLAGDFTGPLNEDGTLLYRAIGLVRDAEISVGGMPDDRVFLAPSLTWRPSSGTSLTVLSEILRMRVGSSWNSYPSVGTLLPNPNGRIPIGTSVGERDFSRYHQDQWMLGYLLAHRIDDTWTLRQNARYGRFDVDYRTFYNGQFVEVDAGDPGNPANFRLMERTPFGSEEDTRSLLVDTHAQAQWHVGDWQHTLLVGLDYQRTRIDTLARYGGTADPIDLYAPVYGSAVTLNDPYIDSGTTLSQTGLYVQDQAKLGQSWVFTAAGRYDDSRITVDDRLAGSSSRQPDHQFTGRAGVVYLAPSGWAPYLSYAQSYFPSTTRDVATGALFKPETGSQWEAGVRYQPPGGKATYSAAVFDLRRRNYVSYSADYTETRQIGEVQVRGLEFEAVGRPMPQLNLTAAYSWTPKADVTSSNTPAEIGKQLNAVARHQLALWADYRFSNGFKAGLGARYTGSTRGSQEAAPVPIPAYTLVDAMLGYAYGPWSFALNARNLTDKTYVATCDGSGTSCSYGSERSVNGTVSYQW